MIHTQEYDAIAILGDTFDFNTWRFPQHSYMTLDEAARVYQAGAAPGGIAVSGRMALKDLQNPRRQAPALQADDMKAYLMARHGIPEQAIFPESESVDTTHNFICLRKIIEEEGWRSVYIPIAADRVDRAAFLGEKVCYGLCTFDVQGMECNARFPLEPRVLGNYACALKDVAWGDQSLDEPRWRALYAAHIDCEFYVPQAESEDYVNYHPEELMQAYLTPPSL